MDIEYSEHELIRLQDTRTQCVKCLRVWKTAPHGSKCPSIPVYSSWTHGLLTKKQLDSAGYQTGKLLPKPAALMPRRDSPNGYLRLYNPADATKKKVMTDGQRQAIEKAHKAALAKWNCPVCGNKKDHLYDKFCGYCQHERKLEKDRNSSIIWSRAILESDYIIMDTETTGLYDAEIVELAIIDLSGNVLLNTRINPVNGAKLYEKRNGIAAVDVHGITIEALQEAPTFPETYEAIKAVLQYKDLLIYNFAYDSPLLNHVCRLHQLDEIEIRYSDCVMNIYAKFYGRWNNYFESYTWQPLPSGDHSALGDCRATLALIKRMASSELSNKYHTQV